MCFEAFCKSHHAFGLCMDFAIQTHGQADDQAPGFGLCDQALDGRPGGCLVACDMQRCIGPSNAA
jgi:hypothetical protein